MNLSDEFRKETGYDIGICGDYVSDVDFVYNYKYVEWLEARIKKMKSCYKCKHSYKDSFISELQCRLKDDCSPVLKEKWQLKED